MSRMIQRLTKSVINLQSYDRLFSLLRQHKKLLHRGFSFLILYRIIKYNPYFGIIDPARGALLNDIKKSS